ncbi:MAG: sugar phosphate isomerase/epimerase [Oscillospiraceae bacterium]|nr:sugar phosphate isomerase/epimerase [Oscillospiraceae bacterium]
MWRQKVGISLNGKYDCPIEEVIGLIKETGFEAVSPDCKSAEGLSELPRIISAAGECGLSVQSLHAPTAKTADLWSCDAQLGAEALNDYLAIADNCAQYGIPIMVVHAWRGMEYRFDPKTLYYENFDKLVSFAGRHGVRIAFENTEGEEYLLALMAHFKDCRTVGYCWDSGHEMCYNHSRDLLAELGDRLIMTHLNDNLGISRFDGRIAGTDDLHLLPYDGIADWDAVVARLKKAAPVDILNLEVKNVSRRGRHDNDAYGRMPLARYFAEAYRRACKIAYGYAR